jgi:hypothetical protein
MVGWVRGKIFVNYRRQQEGGWAAEAIATKLAAAFGADQVFLDTKNIRPSAKFAEEIRTEIARAAALVVVMAEDWHKVQDKDSGDKRITQDDDWVREEIRTAIGLDLPIFVVLLDGATLPRREWLPEDIRAVLEHQATQIRQATADADLERLLAELARVTGLPRAGAPNPPRSRPARVARRQDIVASRAPIVIAIEDDGARLKDHELLAAERHLTVTLPGGALAAIQTRLAGAPSIEAIVELGREAWRALTSASPRLDNLFRQVAAAQHKERHPQPIAWTGRLELLASIHQAIAVAYVDDAEPPGFLSVAFGAHYFHPLSGASRSIPRGALPPAPPAEPSGSPPPAIWLRRSMQRRRGDGQASVQIGIVEPVAGDAGLRAIARALDSEVVVVSADHVDETIDQIAKLLPRQPTSPTRVVVAFGASSVAAPLIDAALSVVPCISFAGPGVRRTAAPGEAGRASEPALKAQAVPVVLSRIRAELVADALDADADVALDELRDALTWSTWSWVGRPLFSARFGEVAKAAYPHLMDLRAVASSDWYFERAAEIPALYRTSALTARNPERRFHLYVSGAGGTGKSCFLRSIYDKLEVNDAKVLPVWYKVHAPSSEWDEVERQIKKELRAALERRFGADHSVLSDGDDRKDLWNLLLDLLDKLRARGDGISQIVLFIDQLERTFESGDNPELGRLMAISAKLVELLQSVGVDNGVRVFVASRKQYLADFLSSFEKAEDIHLHFNVLQTLPVEKEGARFVKRILGWCNDNGLTGARLAIEDGAAQLLAAREHGHPLNLMLALIQLLSHGDLPGEIGAATLEDRRPWEQRFHVDEALMGKDDLDWYFFLAMAHARTEIVRREEVLWRLGLVSRELARQVKELGPHGVLERLWLLGHLGRTIHPRALGDDSARFVEFFHANLRDHLISNVMNRAEDRGEPRGATRRRQGMPPAWRALDRLREIARDWEQVQQPLVKEDITVLMDHKEVFTERVPVPGKDSAREVENFYLLFMRDVERDALFHAARECVAYSALVHDVNGRWAFRTLFPSVAGASERDGPGERRERRGRGGTVDDSQVGCCRRWLRGRRADSQSRHRILQYLIELRDPHANRLLAELVFDETADDEAWQQLAGILAEPLVAATHRSAFLTYAVQHLLDAGLPFPGEGWHTERFGAFLVAAAGGDRDEVGHLLETLPAEVAALGDRRLEPVLRELGNPERVDRWLGSWLGSSSAVPGQRELQDAAEVELRVGEALAATVDATRVERWMDEVGARLSVRPAVVCSTAEISRHRRTDEAREAPPAGYELQLLIRGRLIALGRFFPERVQTLTRDWDGDADGAVRCFNEALWEPVRWVDEAALASWRHRRWAFDPAVIDWLTDLLRRHIASVFTYDDIYFYLARVAESARASRAPSDLTSLSSVLYPVWVVVTRLIRERAPLAERGGDVLLKLIDLVRESDSFDVALIAMRLREHVSDDLCRAFADASNQLLVLLLDLPDEQWLVSKLNKTATRLSFDLTPEEALRTVVAVRERFDEVSRTDHAPAVLVCADNLRAPLFEMLQRFDPRIFVLSYAELSPEVRLTSRGVIRRFSGTPR